MKFKQFGYTEKVIEVRKMAMGDIILTVAQAMISKNVKNTEIRIVDCFMGEVEIFNGLDDLLKHDWSGTYEVNVYDITMMHNNVTDTDYIKIVMSDDVE